MRTKFVAALLCAVTAGGTVAADRVSPCSFAISPPAGPPEVVVGSDTAGRASVMTQRDSPLAIVRADFGGVALTAAEGSFTRTGSYLLDVRNVSDKVITGAQLWVRVGFGPGSGVGSGTKLRRALQPGEQARLEWKSGTGRGSEATDQAVTIVASVGEVQLPGCTYKPSEAWPIRSSGSNIEQHHRTKTNSSLCVSVSLCLRGERFRRAAVADSHS